MDFVFFLGGMDAEMSRIKELLTIHQKKFFCRDLPWNDAKASYYATDLNNLLSNERPVLIELVIDCVIPSNSLIIDPIGESWEKSSLLQICDIIGHKPLNIDLFISANDHGWIPAMYKLGASEEDVATVRLAERRAQGITQEHEKEAIRAIANKKVINGVTIVEMSHSKCAPVTDRLYSDTEKQNLLILSNDGEVNYFGNGLLCKILKDKFDGWNGGSGLGKSEDVAFWRGYPSQEEVLQFITNYFKAEA